MLGADEDAREVEVLRREPRIPIVQHHDARGVWATRGRDVLFGAGDDAPFERIGRFPRASAVDRLAPFRLAARALRVDRCNVHPTRAGRLLGIRACVVYRLEGGRSVPLGRIQGDCLMNRAIAETADGELFFGEYFTNAGRSPVSVWRVDPELTRLERVHVFEAPRVRHVHAVHVDPFDSDRLWVTLGDFEGECFLGTTTDRFRRVSMLGDGSQTFRAVGLSFAPDRIAWLTDSHLEPNRIVSMDRRSGAVETHGDVVASAWYAARTTDGVHLATTTVEPGPAIRTGRSFLVASDDALRWREVASFAKDRYPMRFFKFGSLALPSGAFGSRAFWVSGEGLVGLDGGSMLCALRGPGSCRGRARQAPRAEPGA